MTSAASAPRPAARFVSRIAAAVDSPPVPAIRSFERGVSARAVSMTRSFSLSERSGNSPVEPSTT